jgi:tetratricopeptide (TPR) repeat protein
MASKAPAFREVGNPNVAIRGFATCLASAAYPARQDLAKGVAGGFEQNRQDCALPIVTLQHIPLAELDAVRMFRNGLQKALMTMLVFGGLASASGNPALNLLYQQHRWFELREAIKGHEQNVAALYLGAVASAFNDCEGAERYLLRAIQRAPNPRDASEAHEMLGYLYARSGRYRAATEQFDAILKIAPARSDVENVRAMYAAFGQHPDQSVEPFQTSMIRTEVGRDGIVLPVSIHGKTVRWARSIPISAPR